jgi:hypothetical protein
MSSTSYNEIKSNDLASRINKVCQDIRYFAIDLDQNPRNLKKHEILKDNISVLKNIIDIKISPDDPDQAYSDLKNLIATIKDIRTTFFTIRANIQEDVRYRIRYPTHDDGSNRLGDPNYQLRTVDNYIEEVHKMIETIKDIRTNYGREYTVAPDEDYYEEEWARKRRPSYVPDDDLPPTPLGGHIFQGTFKLTPLKFIWAIVVVIVISIMITLVGGLVLYGINFFKLPNTATALVTLAVGILMIYAPYDYIYTMGYDEHR